MLHNIDTTHAKMGQSMQNNLHAAFVTMGQSTLHNIDATPAMMGQRTPQKLDVTPAMMGQIMLHNFDATLAMMGHIMLQTCCDRDAIFASMGHSVNNNSASVHPSMPCSARLECDLYKQVPQLQRHLRISQAEYNTGNIQGCNQ